MANEKYIMMSDNPTGTGAFSMNRKARTEIGLRSVAEGFSCEASGANSHAEGSYTKASANSSHAEGISCRATAQASHAEGNTTTASSNYSHAEGDTTTASGKGSHAEGFSTKASGPNSHAEGVHTEASGYYSHAEGLKTKASGLYSHSGGNSTIAGYQSQTAIGEYNENKEEDIFEVGNGTSNTSRSNALELTKIGDLKIGGNYIDGSGNVLSMDSIQTQITTNLFNPTLETTTLNGVTCTDNGDGTYTLNGTSTSSSNTNFVMPFSSPFKGKCKLIGCPSDIDSIAELQCNYNGVWDSKNTDHGKGSILDSTNLLTDIAIVILPNVTLNNIVFKLMITTNLDATYNDFVPYTGDTGKLNSDVADIKNDLNNYALKSLYGDTTINVGRLANSAVGNHSTAEGNSTTASGESSHAEGTDTTASGDSSHTEGNGTSATGDFSHAEGNWTTASGESSHAEGSDTTASGNYSHAEGSNFDSSGSEQFPDRKVTISNVEYTIKGSTAYGVNSHAEGTQSFAYGYSSHAEGVNTSAIGQGSHAEGSNLEQNRYNEIVFEEPRRVEVYNRDTDDFIFITVAGSQAFGLNSHAEGCSTLAYGKNSHTEGYHTLAQANESHAEGCGCEANKSFAHAEGQDTIANGNGAHAEGFATIANGTSSHAEGFGTTASGTYSHTEGYYTKATNYASHASGKYNAAMTTGGGTSNTTGTAFVIGNGTGSSALSNAFSVQFDGTVKAKSTITASTTADYAEFFEWLDKNPNEEDRVGHFVTLDGDKIKIATSEDDYILGIVSGEPFVLGNGDCDTWNGMYLHDEFRRTMYEPAPKMIEILDNEGNPTGEYEEVEGEYEGTRPILNPNYDQTKQYISRFDRAEWSPIGMLGVLAVLHDGTAEVNGYVTVNDGGIATKCTRDTRNSYRVIKKVSDKVVEVVFR